MTPLPPYQWVTPPRDLARDNRPPQPGSTSLDLDPTGKSPGSTTTGDGQCTVIFNDGAVAAGPAGHTLAVRLTPLDPATVGAPPAGTRFDGNACRVEVAYGRTGTPPQLRRTITVVLRYATGGTQIAQAVGTDPTSWQPIRSVRYAGHLHLLVADTVATGTFAPLAPAGTPYVQGTKWGVCTALAAMGLIAALLLRWTIIRRRREGR